MKKSVTKYFGLFKNDDLLNVSEGELGRWLFTCFVQEHSGYRMFELTKEKYEEFLEDRSEGDC